MSRGKKRSRRNNAESKRGRAIKLGALGVFAVAALSLTALAFTTAAESNAANFAAPSKPRPTMDIARPTTVPPLVAIIGDSYTGGSEMGGLRQSNWSALVGKDLGWVDCANAVGGSGWTVGAEGNTFGARVDWAVAQRPALIIFFNGINDLNGGPGGIGESADAALKDLQAKAPDVPVVVIGPVLVRDLQAPGVRGMRDEVEDAAVANGATFIDPVAEGWFAGDKRALLGEDEFHPTDEGHRYLAGLMEASVASAGIALSPQPAEGAFTCNPTPAA